MTTPTTKKPATTTSAATPETPTPVDLIGPALRPGQTPEQVTFAHHLRVGGREVRPGDSALVSPDYARQLRTSGYLARTRG
ncbi:hypothetical protein [Streptomyces sp. MBT27]|uniref:hypothetical protein n=1 Tax=Streptomyces sp. MBT27 TaxID=1488356 RepID=UPI00141E5B05|nr:hypothetical protein [Streptomyces sp. MBT27]